MCEYKWFGHPDHRADIVPFEEVADLFGMHEAFLEWLSEIMSAAAEDVIEQLEEHVSVVGVSLSLPYPYPTLPCPHRQTLSKGLW